MKRDSRLAGLSADHHGALVLARRVARDWRAEGAALAADVRRIFEAELAPHFRIEEELLVPALAAAGQTALAERTRADHTALRAHLAAAEQGEWNRLADFAALLDEHVHFEEREMFPAAERGVPAAVLEAVAVRSPHAPRR